ncbi:MAG: glycosyltransferase family 2 protein [Selenomonadaceae bacterium]|nr:glycosyltransferase family 2 protein [Selenomonadaceae bacterium]
MSTEKKLFPLAHIVFPDADFMEVPDLFYHVGEASARLGDGRLLECRTLSFDTWMNLFAAKKWYSYCDLGRLFLKLQVKGSFRLQVTGHEFMAAFGVVDRVLLSQFQEGEELREVLVELPPVEEYAGISFRLDFPQGEDYALGEMCWCTDAPPKRENRMAVVTCTFRRERYVRKTVRKFREFMEEDGRKSSFHLFVVDNGRTLEESLGSDCVTVIPNKNAGGAGGFCRGLMEANDRGFTHCLFMDDDVEIFPESFFRTLAITDYFKEAYRTCSVNGPMMNLYDKMELFENLAAYDGAMGFLTCRGPLRMDSVGKVLESIDLPGELFREGFLHSAWWYTCCSLERYKDEYPVPVFFRCDDVEWSWRKQGMDIVSMNGICLWHAPFQWRTGKLADCYYWPRNTLLICMIHQEGKNQGIFEYLRERFSYLLDILDYVGAEVFLASLTEFMKGHRIFMEDPEEQMQRVRAMCGKAVIRKSVDYVELEKAGKRQVKAKDKETGISLDWYPPARDFKGKSRVEVYNLSGATCETRKRDDARAERLEKEFRMLLHVLALQYESLRQDMRKGYRIFCTREFWDGYLGISRNSQETGGSREYGR